ncbi:MAG: hypothetical protein LIO52_05110 [Oscillospiraceae bacterium]|nr:hypothetical protein [Oscillospiraceae bacterium]
MSLRRMYVPSFVCCLAVFLAALILVTLNFAADEANWFANLFSYRFYIVVLTPVYLLICAALDRQMTTPCAVRVGSRKKAAAITLLRQCGFAFVCFCTWTALVCLFAILCFCPVTEKSALDILDAFLKELLGFMLMGTLASVFRRASVRVPADNAYILTFLLAAADNFAAAPFLYKYTSFRGALVFSWVFTEGCTGYAALLAALALLTAYLFRVSVRGDIF